MARPQKVGLDYFPLDVDIFDDEKMTMVSGEFGFKGEILVIKLLCAIYRNGYFARWNEVLRLKLAKSLPGISADLIETVVNSLVRWEFFDKSLFDSERVLTSCGIQRRYFAAVKRRSQVGEIPYLLVNVCNNSVNVCNNSVNVDKNPTKKSKENTLPSRARNEETDESGWRDSLRCNLQFVETLAINNGVTCDTVVVLIDEFHAECAAKGIVHNGWGDYRRHCYDWARIHLERQNKNKKGNGNDRQRREDRRGEADFRSTSEKDYKTTF